MLKCAKRVAFLLLLLMAASPLFADFRPIEDIHPESITTLLPKLGYSPWALVGKTRERPAAYLSLLDYEKDRVESVRQANQDLRRQGALCDEVKVQQAYFFDSAQAAASAMGLGPLGFGGSAEDQAFRREMIAVHRELRREYARYDLLKSDLAVKLAAEVAQAERTRQAAEVAKTEWTRQAAEAKQSGARNSVSHRASDGGLVGLSDSTVFLIALALTGLWAFSSSPQESGFGMRWFQGIWVTVLIMVSLGYLNSGPRGAASLLGASVCSGPSMGLLFAIFSIHVGYADKGKSVRSLGDRKGAHSAELIGRNLGLAIGRNLGLALVAYVKVFWIPVGLGLLYFHFNQS